ncbi:MAG: hypothetical protein FWD27_03505 [Coriobacteriia bacterium]|nr:hypothetical protein [Coriobacteriia bacterium]
MSNHDRRLVFNHIVDLVVSGEKLSAIKEFLELFGCDLKQARDGVEEMLSTRNFQWEYYEQKYGEPASGGKKKSKKGVLLFLFIVLTLVLVCGLPVLHYTTEVFRPHAFTYSVAVELENGEVFRSSQSGLGAVNRQGELLINYRASDLAFFVALHLDPYYDFRDTDESARSTVGWIVLNTDNPFYQGSIDRKNDNIKSYYSSERMYSSPSNYYFQDSFFDQRGMPVWSHSTEENAGSLFQRVTVSESIGSSTYYGSAQFLNVNQFLEQTYGIVVQMTYDKKDACVVFKVTSAPLDKHQSVNHA